MNTKKILWIDDEADKLSGLFTWMDKREYNLVKRRDRISAENEIEKGLDGYDVVILDLILPKGRDYSESEITKVEHDRFKLEGIEILEKIRNKSDIPIVIMTVVSGGGYYSKINEYKKQTDNNIKEVLTKGTLTPNEVKAALENILEKSNE